MEMKKIKEKKEASPSKFQISVMDTDKNTTNLSKKQTKTVIMNKNFLDKSLNNSFISSRTPCN